MIGKISFCSYGTDSCSAVSGGLYPCFVSVGNQRNSAEKPYGDKVSQGVFILSALLLKYQLIPSRSTSLRDASVTGLRLCIAITKKKKPKAILKQQTWFGSWF